MEYTSAVSKNDNGLFEDLYEQIELNLNININHFMFY